MKSESLQRPAEAAMQRPQWDRAGAVACSRRGGAAQALRGAPALDLVFVALSTALALLVGVRLELFEGIAAWVEEFEALQLDEMLVALLVCLAGLSLSLLRRWRQSSRELRLRQQLQDGISNLLAENRRLARQLIQAQEQERLALARELHDELGQYCNAIKVEAVGILTAAQAESVPQRARSIAGIADLLHDMVRDVVARLRPAALDELGLEAAVQRLVEAWEERHGIPCVCTCAGDIDELGESINITVYRVVQECLTNVARHSGASHVTVRIRRGRGRPANRQGGWLEVAVHDDGVGLVPGAPRTGFGLLGMQERVHALGGSLDTSAGPGLRVEVRLPTGGS